MISTPILALVLLFIGWNAFMLHTLIEFGNARESGYRLSSIGDPAEFGYRRLSIGDSDLIPHPLKPDA